MRDSCLQNADRDSPPGQNQSEKRFISRSTLSAAGASRVNPLISRSDRKLSASPESSSAESPCAHGDLKVHSTWPTGKKRAQCQSRTNASYAAAPKTSASHRASFQPRPPHDGLHFSSRRNPCPTGEQSTSALLQYPSVRLQLRWIWSRRRLSVANVASARRWNPRLSIRPSKRPCRYRTSPRSVETVASFHVK